MHEFSQILKRNFINKSNSIGKNWCWNYFDTVENIKEHQKNNINLQVLQKVFMQKVFMSLWWSRCSIDNLLKGLRIAKKIHKVKVRISIIDMSKYVMQKDN